MAVKQQKSGAIPSDADPRAASGVRSSTRALPARLTVRMFLKPNMVETMPAGICESM